MTAPIQWNSGTISSTIWSTSDSTVASSIINDPETWNNALQLREEDCQSEMHFGSGRSLYVMRFEAPPPNWLRRLIWKWALGVTWKDLRPERQMDELRTLK